MQWHGSSGGIATKHYMRTRVPLQVKYGKWQTEFLVNIRMHVPSLLSLAPTPTIWTVPPSGFFKVNVNDAASDDGKPSSIRVIIRNCRGSPIAALSRISPVPFFAEITEAMALQEGVLLAFEMGISQAIFESDTLSTVQATNEGVLGGEMGHIIQNVRDISCSFSWFSFKNLKRSGNKAAHELARAARFSGVSQVWKGISPCCVERVILEDCGI